MLHTFLTDSWHLRYPIIGAPMAGAAYGRLARAISMAGGLGMIGIGSRESVDFIEREASIARGDDSVPFGVGLMIWAIEARPELLEAVLQTRPFLISLSFGSPAPYVERLHQLGIRVATQVNTRADALEAAQAGVDLVVAQGTEAGGHTGQVSTLPLLQIVLETVQVPVVAAGGIATARGLAAVLAAGAAGIWSGTCFLTCPESATSESARERILQAQEMDTVYTRVFDKAYNIPWPARYPGRALRNRFTDQWQHRENELIGNSEARQELSTAARSKDFEIANIYAGEAVGLVTQSRPVAEVVHEIGNGAEQLLHDRLQAVLDHSAS